MRLSSRMPARLRNLSGSLPFWGRHLWARGYFCCSSGNVTDEVIKAYIENQSHEDDVDFRVEGESEPAKRGRPPKPSS
jgi:REP element-mobilizing transposase RayT